MFLRSGRIDDVVSIFHLLLQRHLPAQPVFDLFACEMVATDSAGHLLLLCTRRNDEPIVIAKAARLYQYRSFINDDAMGFAPGERLGKLLGSRADGRVNDGVEFL